MIYYSFQRLLLKNLFSRRLCIINYFIKYNVTLYHLQYRRTGFARPTSLARACASVCYAPCSPKLLLTDVRTESVLFLFTEYEFSQSININIAVLFYFCEESIILIINSACIEFVGYNLKGTRRRHVCNFFITKLMLSKFRYLSAYQIPTTFLASTFDSLIAVSRKLNEYFHTAFVVSYYILQNRISTRFAYFL